MKHYDLTGTKVIEALETPWVYCNDNSHEWWVNPEPIKVKSLFDMVDYAKLKRERFEVVK